MNYKDQIEDEIATNRILNILEPNISPHGTANFDKSNVYELSRNGGAIEKVFDGQFENVPIIIYRETATKYHAYCSVCPHEFKKVRAPFYPATDLVCFAHHTHFSPIDGHVIMGPSKDSLTKYQTSFDTRTNILKILG